MNREIKFRGKCAFSGVWRYGYFYISKGNHIIRDSEDNESIVLKESVGQFTGLKDKNGVEIYDGDVAFWEGKNRVFIYGDGCFGFEGVINPNVHINEFNTNQMVIAGNIHDNPKLIK